MTTTSGGASPGAAPTPPTGPSDPKPAWRRALDWFRGLSEAGKVGVIGGVITLTGSILAAIIGPVLTAALSNDGDSGKAGAVPSATQSKNPGQDDSAGDGEQSPKDQPSATSSAASSNPTYKVEYEDKKMQLGKGDGAGTLDFDKPASRLLSEDEWTQLGESAESQSRPVEPDLAYVNQDWGIVSVLRGRNAAQLDSPPKSGKDCALSANLGGFSEASVSDGLVKPGDIFCFITDQNNVVSAEIIRILGEGLHRTPIEFTVTMWKPE
ncbi:hypothetical protein ACH5AU_30815 [Streptomyces albidoflavus]